MWGGRVTLACLPAPPHLPASSPLPAALPCSSSSHCTRHTPSGWTSELSISSHYQSGYGHKHVKCKEYRTLARIAVWHMHTRLINRAPVPSRPCVRSGPELGVSLATRHSLSSSDKCFTRCRASVSRRNAECSISCSLLLSSARAPAPCDKVSLSESLHDSPAAMACELAVHCTVATVWEGTAYIPIALYTTAIKVGCTYGPVHYTAIKAEEWVAAPPTLAVTQRRSVRALRTYRVPSLGSRPPPFRARFNYAHA